MKYFVFDCETGGMPEKNTSLLTMNGSLLDAQLNVVATIGLKVKPADGVYRVQPQALNVNGIELGDHDDIAITEEAAAVKFIDFIRRHNLGGVPIIPVGHNVAFDVSFMKKLIGGNNWRQLFSKKVIDTASVAEFLCLTGVLPESARTDCSLQGLADLFDMSYVGAHNAEFDMVLTLNVLKKLISLVSERKK